MTPSTGSGCTFRICAIGPSGALDLSPITLSPEAAARRDPAAFMAFYEECRRVVEKQEKPKAKQLSMEFNQ
jgi:hypothetical protein